MIYLILFNLFLVVIMIFFEYKNIKTIILWSIVIFLFSFLGFIAYCILGNALKFKTKQMIIKKYNNTKYYIKKTNWFNSSYSKIKSNIDKTCNNNLLLWKNNKIKIYNNGKSFFNDLIKDINNAKRHIHLEFYIWSDDSIGNKIAKLLINKAKMGVKIKIIYDSFGSKNIKKEFWEKLKKNNIEVINFFPPLFNIPFFNFKINYRNHRKIVIIDGIISYVGGINLREDHMNLDSKLFPWRDTTIKIIGSATYALQDIFINDFYFTNASTISQDDINDYFPISQSTTGVNLQILKSSTIDNKKHIYDFYLKLINSSSKFIFIETPYFVINKKMMKTIIKAKKRGCVINILIPKIPDKKIIYNATLLYLKNLIKNNINIYLYNGFIHSKMFLTENVVSIGSCNFDNRSFFLNFETTCLCYNDFVIKKALKIGKNDIKSSTLLTNNMYKKMKPKNIFKILFYKLISKYI